MKQEKQNSKKNILIVEDEVFLAETIGARLEFLGYTVSYAENGQVALDKCSSENLKKVPVDLILMDALMPIMDGFEATRLIKANQAKIPIVFVTAMARPEDKEKACNVGADDYLAKPFEVSELITLIKKWLER